MTEPNKNQQPSWIWSAIGVAVVVALLHVVVQWHKTTEIAIAKRNSASFSHGRSFLLDIEDAPSITDDATRDQTCKDYIINFMNGSTDARDYCEGLYSALKAADCKDGSHSSFLSRKHKAANGSMTDDNVLIDDEFENWECCLSITDYYAKKCQKTGLGATRLLGIVSVLLVCGFLRSFLRMTGVKWVPDAGVCIIVGAITGLILRFIKGDFVRNEFSFDNDLFLQILLPPIIFHAALMIDKAAFRRDFFPILTFAVFGTCFTAVAIGYITFYLSGWLYGPSLPLLDSLLFGALMSSIDPVATLSILTSVGVSQTDTLYTLIFGESLLNDGVSIVLFDSLVRHAGDADVVDTATVHATLQDFFWVTFGSIAVGVFSAALATLYFWFLQGKQSAVVEVGLFFAWALVPYYVADGLGFSGIIAILVMGLMMDYFVVGGNESEEAQWMQYMEMPQQGEPANPHQYHRVEHCLSRMNSALAYAFSGRGHLNTKSLRHVGFVAEVISSLMETAIFAYLGLFLFNEKSWDFMLMTTGIFACATSRAGMVILLSLIVNLCVWIDLEGHLGRLWRHIRPRGLVVRRDTEDYRNETKPYLDRRTQLILFSAGVRGAVSYALVQNIPMYNAVTKQGSHFKGELKAMASATIVVLMFAFGAITYYAVQSDWNQPRSHAAERLRLSLMSTTLDSDDGNDDATGLDSLSLEIEGRHNTNC